MSPKNTLPVQGEIFVIGADRKAYQLPCGLLCSIPETAEDADEGTCLDQIKLDDVPAYEVNANTPMAPYFKACNTLYECSFPP